MCISNYSTSCDLVTPWLLSIYGHLWSQWPTLVLLQYPVMSRAITQPCALAKFSFNAPRSAFCRTCIGEFLTMAYHGLLWQAFILERSVVILIASNQGRTQVDAAQRVTKSQFVL